MNRFALLSLAALASGLAAQSNVVAGLDGRLSLIDNLTYYGRRGAAHPNGEVGMAMLNTMCNPGSVGIPWFAAMSSNHPKFGFLLVRVHNGRLEQISDWSYVKHAFTSTNFSGACGTCNTPGGSTMGVGCSDTYGDGNNADRFWLGPPEEIDPWLGTWNPIGSYFDRGDPAGVGRCGDRRQPLAEPDADQRLRCGEEPHHRQGERPADVGGAQYFYGIQLIHEGEAVANRWRQHQASRGFTQPRPGTAAPGPWPNNGVGDDVRLDPARTGRAPTVNSRPATGTTTAASSSRSKATALGGGMYHYEYAVHNVDNQPRWCDAAHPDRRGRHGRLQLHVPRHRHERAEQLDSRRASATRSCSPLRRPTRSKWNTIYNFGFDANFAPGSGVTLLDEARLGPGALSVTVAAKVPSGTTVAQWSPVGTGCGGGSNCQTTFYQLFSPASAFDLANSQWSLTFNGNGYTLGPGTGTYVAPTGTALTMSDDTEVSTAIPFALPYPGGTTSTLWVCSNGFVSAASNGASFTPAVAGFLSGAPCWAALWHDLNPSTGQVRVDATPAVVRVSYTAVPNFSGGGTATFQFQFFPNGNVNVIYQAVAAAGNDYLTGYTLGGGAADPGNWDISANLAGGLSLCAGPGSSLALASSARPILGTSINLDTTNIPAGSLVGISILSLTQYTPGLDLSFLGMPTCTLYAGLDVLNTFATPSSSASVGWAVPNAPSAAGVSVMSQSAVLKIGVNAFGAITSNAVQLVLGVN